MGAWSKARQFELVAAVLAMVDERGDVGIDEAAAELGVDGPALRALVAPVVLLEYRAAKSGEIIGELSSFLLTENERIQRLEEHWLRDLASVPPDPDDALRLLLCATHFRALAPGRNPDLDRAIEKLQRVLAADVVVPVDRPPCLAVAEEAFHTRRTLRFRYVKDGHTDATEREVEPHLVFCRWGHWYVMGRAAGEDAVKEFRVDRMLDAALGGAAPEPPEEVAIPEWFDLEAHARTVRVRVAAADLEGLPQPHRLGGLRELADGRVEVDVSVNGQRRLEHLLVALGPEAEIVDPDDAAVRRAHAAAILAVYDAPGRP